MAGNFLRAVVLVSLHPEKCHLWSAIYVKSLAVLSLLLIDV